MTVAAGLPRGQQGTLLHKRIPNIVRKYSSLHVFNHALGDAVTARNISAPFEAQVGKQRPAMTLLFVRCQPPESGTIDI